MEDAAKLKKVRPLAERVAELEKSKDVIEAKKRELAKKLRKLKAAGTEAERKADTRRKIIIGAIILDHAKDKPEFAQWLQQKIDNLGERDKAAFDGWKVPGNLAD